MCVYIYPYIDRNDEPPLQDTQSVIPTSESSSSAWPSCSWSTGSALDCGMPTCKRPIMQKICMLHEATWKHDSNPCTHWFAGRDSEGASACQRPQVSSASTWFPSSSTTCTMAPPLCNDPIYTARVGAVLSWNPPHRNLTAMKWWS